MAELHSGSTRSTTPVAAMPALPNEDSLVAARRRVFVVTLVLSAGAALIAWIVEWRDARLDPFETWVLPMLALFFLVLAGVHSVRTSRAGEIAGLAAAALFIVTRTAYILHSGAVEGSEQLFELVELLSWAPAVYLLGFLVLESVPSLVGGASMLVIAMATVWLWASSAEEVEPRFRETLVQIFAANGAVLALLYALSRLKDRWLRMQVVAETLQQFAGTDFLTGVANRRHLHSVLSKERERAIRHDERLAVILLDLDHFKSINDRFGHDTGDQVLKQVASLLSRETRSLDSFGRWGGEEFLVVVPHSDLEPGRLLAERLRVAMEGTTFVPGERLTASFGVSELGEEESIGRLLRRADEGLMRAKKHGRNRVVAIELGEDPDTGEGDQLQPPIGPRGGHL